MANLKLLVLFCASVCGVFAKHEIYEGHSLYEVTVTDGNQAKFVNEIENRLGVDVFTFASLQRAGHILVPGELKPEFESTLTEQGIDYKIQVENIREHLEMEDKLLAAAAARSRSNRTAKAVPGLNFDEIHRYTVVNDYLDELGAAYPDIVTVETAGQSFEGRDIKYVKISTTNFEDRTKPVIFIMSLLHAREWVTLPATLYAIEKLVINVEERDLLDTLDWIILPVANPDGYEFSHTTTRFWRKNRATGFQPGNNCMGVDLNRNFESPFWGQSSSANPCSETFHGNGPFSEPETSHLRDLLMQYRDRIGYFGDMHSFGSMILYGWGNGELVPNALVVHLNGVYQAQAIDNVKWGWKRNYVVGNVVNILYLASGISSDYAQLIGIPFSYTYELPAYMDRTGTINGFLVQPEFIKQAGVETWEGIKTGARFVRDNYW